MIFLWITQAWKGALSGTFKVCKIVDHIMFMWYFTGRIFNLVLLTHLCPGTDYWVNFFAHETIWHLMKKSHTLLSFFIIGEAWIFCSFAVHLCPSGHKWVKQVCYSKVLSQRVCWLFEDQAMPHSIREIWWTHCTILQISYIYSPGTYHSSRHWISTYMKGRSTIGLIEMSPATRCPLKLSEFLWLDKQ